LDNKEFFLTRQCPTCKKELIYSCKSTYKQAIKNNQQCIVCSKISSGLTLDQNKITQIISLNEDGLSNRAISKILHISTTTIKKYLENNNKCSNWSGNKTKLDIMSDSEAKCRVCQNILPLSEFIYFKNNTKYKFDVCSSSKCRNKTYYNKRRINFERAVKKDIDILLHYKYIGLKNKSKRDNIIFNISELEFKSQFYSQNEKCFYTDEKMKIEFSAQSHKNGADRETLSIDKIIPSEGYVLGNVVFCCNKINFVKRDLSLAEIKQYLAPFFYERIVNFKSK
jgi:predicted transcriptional regulator